MDIECSCSWCLKGFSCLYPIFNPDHPIKYTTVVICKDKSVYDLGKGEFPPSPQVKGRVVVIKEPKHKVINAFACTQEEADRLKKK